MVTSSRRRSPCSCPWTTSGSTLALLLLLCADAGAGPSTDRLDAFFTKVNHVLGRIETEADLHERLPAVRKLVSEIFDVRAAAERALGREWHARTPAEQDEFVDLFADLLERTFLARVGSTVDVSGGVRARYLAESVEGDHATVLTAMESKAGSEMPIEYRMRKRGDRWAVSAVVVDLVSLVKNYGAQFSRVLGAASYPELLARMRAKVSRPPVVTTARANLTVDPGEERGPEEARPVAAERQRSVQVENERGVTPAPVVSVPPLPAVEPDALLRTATQAKPPLPVPVQAVALRAPTRSDPAPAAGGVPSYWVQVGAFKTAELAVRLVSRLRDQRVSILTGPGVSVNGGGGTSLFRVRIGPFGDHAEAVAKLRELQRTGYESFIVAGRGG